MDVETLLRHLTQQCRIFVGLRMSSIALPTLAAGTGLRQYLTAIKQFPMLTAEQEKSFAGLLRDRNDEEAAYQLVTSHLRLVAKIAMRYRGYGLPIVDVISEGNVGLMQAVRRFDPNRGFRLATYATWWIKATIQDFVLRSWSIVKIAATTSQKRLFFNLRKLKSKIAALEEGDLRPEHSALLAKRLAVPEIEVVEMNRRFMGDMSLNALGGVDDEAGTEWQERLADSLDLEATIAEIDEEKWRSDLLRRALQELPLRERRILQARWLSENPATLDELGAELGISRERVRQIEERALKLARRAMTAGPTSAQQKARR